MNEIIENENKLYEMMKEHQKLSRETAKEVLRMDLNLRKRLNKISKKKINKNNDDKDKAYEFIKLLKQLKEAEQDAIYQLMKLTYKSENKQPMTNAEKELFKILLKHSIQ